MPRAKKQNIVLKSKYFQNEIDEDIPDENGKDNSDPEDDIDYEPNKKKKTTPKKRKSTTMKTNSHEQPRIKKPRKTTSNKKPKVSEKNEDLNNNDVSKDISHNNQDSDEDEDDWEEVPNAEIIDLDEYKPDIPENLQISIDPSSKKSKKKTDPIEALIRQRINRCRKENQLNMHKCSILLLIHRFRFLNRLTIDPLIQAFVQSIEDLIPKQKHKESLSNFMKKIMHWFKRFFTISVDDFKDDKNFKCDIRQELIKSFETLKIPNFLLVNLILIALLRSLNLIIRLCHLLNPVTLKPPNLLGVKKLQEKPENDPKSYYTWFWFEIFDHQHSKWICFDPESETFDDPKELSMLKTNHKTHLIAYILAIDNQENISEVTARYAPDWVSRDMEKRRIQDGWWEETLALLKTNDYSKYDDADKVEFENIVAKVKLPKRISDYKNHPLFVLRRDLLKFQAIYPPDAPPLGFFREEPVYSRNCVQTLKSRETWLRDARTVKLNEKPYKVVTSRFKWKKVTMPGEVQEKETLDLYGEWQTEPYKPPVAQNGIVPRNAYGNVDLYQSCMLPIGTVHLQLPGLLRIANKLNIDCVPAIVGFEGTCGGAHPVMDGFVVCEEHRQILVDAWNQEQAIQKEREDNKRQKRVLANWKRFIRGLIIKRNLKIKYG